VQGRNSSGAAPFGTSTLIVLGASMLRATAAAVAGARRAFAPASWNSQVAAENRDRRSVGRRCDDDAGVGVARLHGWVVQHAPLRCLVIIAVAVVCQQRGEMGGAPPDGVSAAGFPTQSLRGFPMRWHAQPCPQPGPARPGPARHRRRGGRRRAAGRDRVPVPAGPPRATAAVGGRPAARSRSAAPPDPLPELSAILMHPSCDFAPATRCGGC